ncbi:hypothetical protein MPSEU_000566500 [Mayamaea pseudoterrestris]|nr:hypothetical protein MPSEU_000566500 [Mayamaea pseudoterrestris]
MSVAQRSLTRLPLELYKNLKEKTDDCGIVDDSIVVTGADSQSAATLRDDICSKLRAFSSKSFISDTINERVTTVGGLLKLSPLVLLRVLDPLLTYCECIRFIEQVCVYCAPKPRTALSLLRLTHGATTGFSLTHIPTSLAALDTHLKGGIRIGSITELVGRASAGKTQLAMQLAVSAARFQQGCIYIDTEQKISVPRLRQITMNQAALFNQTNATGLSLHCAYEGQEFEHHVLLNVTIHTPNSTEGLLDVLSGLEDEIIARDSDPNRFSVRLIVLDSIAAPIHRDFGSGSAPRRAAAVMQAAQILKRLADHYNLAIVVINQTGGGAFNQGTADSIDTSAALGTAWHHCVTTRVQLEHNQQQHIHDQSIIRRCSVVKSNVVAPAVFTFRITELGIVA